MGVPPKRKKKFGRLTARSQGEKVKRKAQAEKAGAEELLEGEFFPVEEDMTPSPSPTKIWKDASRSRMTQEQREKEIESDRKRKQRERDNLDSDEHEEILDEQRDKQRKRRELPPSRFEGRQVPEVIFGGKIVIPVDIGRLCDPRTGEYNEDKVIKCQFCNALRWNGEPKGFCCSGGKVELDPIFPDDESTDPFKELFTGSDRKACVFRKHVIPLNNALSLASLKVNRVDPPGGGFKPSVVIQGKVAIKMGPIQPIDDRPPAFAQFYVLDPTFADKELELRMGNMYIGRSVPMVEKEILRELLGELQDELKRCNPYVKDFIMATEIIEAEDPAPVTLIIDAKKRPTGEHERKFNPGFQEISVLIHDQAPANHDFVVRLRAPGNHAREIRDTNRAADALRFVLLFPTGVDGWRLDLPKHRGDPESGNCSGRKFYGYHFQVRVPFDEPGNFNILLRGGRLFQELACLAMAKIQNQELKWYAMNQKTIRAEKYSKAYEDYHTQDADTSKIGQMVILPPSYIGSPRHMHRCFQDGVAIVRENHKPDLFITFTANPKWLATVESLFPGQEAKDRPDLVARVFNQMLKSFHRDMKDGQFFGKLAGQLNVVEFQKRGLPHNHYLLILEQQDRIRTAEEVDQLICAEIPPDPLEYPEGPARDQAQELLNTVLDCMYHSCSPVCLENGKCKKFFPKAYCSDTKWDDDNMYPEYRRREGRTVVHKGKICTNQYVVPYNPILLLKYKCHINVECCASVQTIKYLYLYLFKGGDRLMITTSNKLNEIEHYENCRSIGSSEACHRMFEFRIADHYPSVTALRIHLEGDQMIPVDPNDIQETLKKGPPETELTGFFKFNRENPEVQLRYVDFPKSFRWDRTACCWKLRLRESRTIGRVNVVHPTAGDSFYLRLLLHQDHSKGKTSFEDLRTVDEVTYNTFKEACGALSLLQDDGEWESALQEAAHTKTSGAIRVLFDVILRYCDPQDPRALFQAHFHEWWDDFKRKYQTASEEQLQIMVLLDLETKLQQNGKELKDFDLPFPSADERKNIAQLREEELLNRDTVVMQEETNYDLEETIAARDSKKALLNIEQRAVFEEVMDIVENYLDEKGFLKDLQSFCMFIDARGGTGKTFLLNTILSAARTLNGEKNIALAVAYSGIAATLLDLGRTFHSRFKVPLKIIGDTVNFNLKPNSAAAKVIAKAKLIVWDEGPMANRSLLEGLDRTLRDITQVDKPFGGKIIIVAGDFRQVLPVIKYASRAQIVDATLSRSPLFSLFERRKLVKNLRVGDNPAFQAHDQFLLDMGDGCLPVIEEPDWVNVPERHLYEIEDSDNKSCRSSLLGFVDLIFEDLHERAKGDQDEWICWVSERAILAPKNVEVDKINEEIISFFPGDVTVAKSADACVSADDGVDFPVELLNTQLPNGIPPHHLCLKTGIVLILLRNLNPKEGLCNGTRLVVSQISQFLLYCRIASGSKAGNLVLIPRLDLKVDDGSMAIEWKRRQFPVRIAFAMTINKSQGQTLKKVGVWLHESCFTSGQLYVASSRVGNPENLHYAVNAKDNGLMKNVVYQEALLEHRVLPISTPRPKLKVCRSLAYSGSADESRKEDQEEEKEIVQLPLLESIPEEEQETCEVMPSINTCTLSLESIAEEWSMEVKELKKHLTTIKGFVHTRPFSCAVDSILDLLHYTFLQDLLKEMSSLCPAQGRSLTCQCEFCSKQSPFFKRSLEYSLLRGDVKRRKDLLWLNNEMWDLMLYLLPNDFAPKGTGQAGNQDIPRLFLSTTQDANHLWGVHRVSKKCSCGSILLDVQLPLELHGESQIQSFTELVTTSALIVGQCPTCFFEVEIESFSFKKYLIFNMELAPNLQNEKKMLPEVVVLQGNLYELTGFIKNIGGDEGTGLHHFVAILKTCGKIIKLDDLNSTTEEFTSFHSALEGLRGEGNLLQRICCIIYSTN